MKRVNCEVLDRAPPRDKIRDNLSYLLSTLERERERERELLECAYNELASQPG